MKQKAKNKKKVAKKSKLKPSEEIFCRLYTQNSQLRSNGTMCYAKAFGYDLDKLSTKKPLLSRDPIEYGESDYEKSHLVCRVMAHKLLTKTNIQKRMVVLLNELLTDEFVDSELAKVVAQDHELPSKMAGIREFNKLKQRIIERADITSDGEKIKTFNETQLQRIASRVVNANTPVEE